MDADQTREDPAPAEQVDVSVGEGDELTVSTNLENNAELKVSRKREREVSLEPPTPQATSLDNDSSESKSIDRDRRKPAKKNRISSELDVTQEQEEDALILDSEHSRTPPLRGNNTPPSPPTSAEPTPNLGAVVPAIAFSPAHEKKIRQISRGVEDINWKNFQGDNAEEPRVDDASDATAAAAKEADKTEMEVDQENTPASTLAASQNVEKVAPLEPSPVILPPGPNPPEIDEIPAGEDEHTGAADPAEVPADAQSPVRNQATVSSGGDDTAKTDEPITTTSDVPEPETRVPLPESQAPSTSVSRRPSPPVSESQVTGIKRKLDDRPVNESAVPETSPKRASPPLEEREGKKALQDTEDGEPETKKLEAEKASTPPPSGGFMAYASTSSPFAKVKGPNIFSTASTSTKPSVWSPSPPPSGQSSFSSSPFSFSPNTTSQSPLAPASSSPSTPGQKRSGFEAFASTTSPFASAAKRPKSPPPPAPHNNSHGFGAFSAAVAARAKSPNARAGSPARTGFGSTTSSAFSAYANATSAFSSAGAGGFAAAAASSGDKSSNTSADESEPKAKRVNGGSNVTFGERLRAEKDNEDDEDADERNKLDLQEQEVMTGEEEDETVYQVRGKLYVLHSKNQWKERGTGNLKLNVRHVDGYGARLVMRKEAVHTLLLNAVLFKGMKCNLALDPRYIRFSVFENGAATHYNLRVSSSKIAEELLNEIILRIPTD